MEADIYVSEYIARARKAQAVLETYTQEQVDALVRAMAKTVVDHAADLAELAVEETKMGNVPDKTSKNLFKARVIWNSLRGKKSVGVIDRDEVTGIVRVAKPVGVVAALTPVTNPIVTPMSNSMFAVKCRNAIIVSPNHSAMKSSGRVVELLREAVAALGAPADIIQTPTEHSREITGELMRQSDLVLATGGGSMVHAAYSSGTPAYGVGAGNVQCILDRGVDIADATAMVVQGRSFDNGITCTSEQSLLIPSDCWDEAIDGLRKAGAYIVDLADVDALRDAAFPEGKMEHALIGHSAAQIGAAAGLSVPEDARILAVPVSDFKDVLRGEKMFPLLTLFRYDTFEQAMEIAESNLRHIGAGHTACIHSHDMAHIERVAELPVSRVVVNQCSTSGGGSFFNGLTPTNTLGCGSWGGNSLSENLGYFHLMNITRIADVRPDNPVPTDEKLFG